MRLRFAVLGVFMFVTFIVAVNLLQSSEPTAPTPSLAETVKQLTERVGKLEMQLNTLRDSDRGVPIPNAARPRYDSPADESREAYPPIYAPGRRKPRGPYTAPRADEPAPKVPDGWQRFEINGQTFYIVPVDQIDSRSAGAVEPHYPSSGSAP